MTRSYTVNLELGCVDKMKKTLAGVILLSGLTLAGCSDQTVASSTAGKISQEDFYEEMKETVGSQVLQQMLLVDILEENASDSVSEEDVQAAYDEELERFGGEEGLNYALMSQGMDIEQYRDTIRLNLLVESTVRDAIEFTDEELQAAYEQYQPQVTAQHILVEEKATADDLIQQLNDGADFTELAIEHSQDPGTAPTGGEVTFTTGEMVPEFEEAAFALEEGEMTQEAVQTEYGYHIIQMNEKPEKGSFEEERETIEEQLIESQMMNTQYVQSVLSDLVQESNVIINDDTLSDAMNAYMPLPDAEDTEAVEEDTTSEVEDSTEE